VKQGLLEREAFFLSRRSLPLGGFEWKRSHAADQKLKSKIQRSVTRCEPLCCSCGEVSRIGRGG